MQVFLFLALIFTMVIVIFAVQNSEIITLVFINWTFEGSLAFILLLTFLAGLLAGIFLFIPAWWRKAMQNRVNKKRVHELEKKLSDIDEQGIKPEHTVEEEY